MVSGMQRAESGEWRVESRYDIYLYIGKVLGHTFELNGEQRAESVEWRAKSGYDIYISICRLGFMA